MLMTVLEVTKQTKPVFTATDELIRCATEVQTIQFLLIYVQDHYVV